MILFSEKILFPYVIFNVSVLKPKLCQLFLFRSRMELKAMEEASFRVDTAVEAVERGGCNSC